jgi:hypothetical protein
MLRILLEGDLNGWFGTKQSADSNEQCFLNAILPLDFGDKLFIRHSCLSRDRFFDL